MFEHIRIVPYSHTPARTVVETPAKAPSLSIPGYLFPAVLEKHRFKQLKAPGCSQHHARARGPFGKSNFFPLAEASGRRLWGNSKNRRHSAGNVSTQTIRGILSFTNQTSPGKRSKPRARSLLSSPSGRPRNVDFYRPVGTGFGMLWMVHYPATTFLVAAIILSLYFTILVIVSFSMARM